MNTMSCSTINRKAKTRNEIEMLPSVRNVTQVLNVCGFHIVVLILLYVKGVSIPSNTTMFDFIFALYTSDMFRLPIWPSSGIRLYYTTVHILITTCYR
jgi:hypothetical protein